MLTIDKNSAITPFQQIRDGIAQQIRAGELTRGQKLPSIRNLAKDLGVAPGTVARAYTELEEAELIESRARLGTRVTGGKEADAKVAALCRQLIESAKKAGLTSAQTAQMVSSLWE